MLKQVTALREAKKDAEAIQLAQKALSIAQQSFPAGSDKLVRPLGVLGWAYYDQGRYAESFSTHANVELPLVAPA